MMIEFRSRIEERKAEILDRWRGAIMEAYPEDTVRFLKREKDPFHNPVGNTVREGSRALLQGILSDRDLSELQDPLEGIVRVRAVQQLAPSAAVGFILRLKSVVRETVPEAADGSGAVDPWADLDSRIDDLALMAFDIYTRCRQEISEIRVGAEKRRVASLLRRTENLESRDGPLENSMEQIDSDSHDRQGGGA